MTGGLAVRVEGLVHIYRLFDTEVVDPLTEVFGMLVWSPELVGFFGVLDQDGRARPRLDLSGLPSLPLALAGRRMTFAAWVQPSLGQLDGLPSTAVDVLLR